MTRSDGCAYTQGMTRQDPTLCPTCGRPRLLDLFCGAGGASVGYHRAGFCVTGMDLEHHPDYPFTLIEGDATNLRFDRLEKCWHPTGRSAPCLGHFAAVAASPPCPRYSRMTPAERRAAHPDLIEPMRMLLRRWGGFYVIENVPDAPLENPVRICGSTFGLGVRRHRLFETNVPMLQPECNHAQQPKVYGVYGDGPYTREFRRPDGTRRGDKARSVEHAGQIMGIDWMTQWDDLADAIPPAYTEFIGEQIMAALQQEVPATA